MTSLPAFHDTARPLIVTGAPRSGTTFLTVAMNQHPQILLTNELRPWSFVNNVRLRLQQPSELLPEHPLRQDFRKVLVHAMLDTVDSFYRTRVPRTGLGYVDGKKASVDPAIRAYGDKNPSYADAKEKWCAGMIAAYWKGSRFVHIHRDPRSCVASYKAVEVYSDEITRGADIWNRHLKTMHKLGAQLGPDRLLNVRYEELVSEDGPEVFARIEAFLGLDHAAEPAAFLKREMRSRTPYRAPTTPEPMLGQTRFSERLSAEEIGYVEHTCRDMMEAFGYAPVHTPKKARLMAQSVEAAIAEAATKARRATRKKQKRAAQ
ncbi:MAG: sulfotransferase family protein [Glycocaulis sp.]